MGWVGDAINSAEQVVELVAHAEDLRLRWLTLLVADVRSDAAARRLLDLIPRHLVVTAPIVADLLGVSAPTARAAIEASPTRGILRPIELRPVRPGRPAEWWMAEKLVSVVGRWSR